MKHLLSDEARAADVEVLLALANTGHVEHDELADAAGLATWWAGLDGVPTWHGAPADADGLALLTAVRRVVRALALRNNGVEIAVDPDDGALVAAVPLYVAVTAGAGLSGTPTELAEAVAVQALSGLVTASARPGWLRTKACPGPDCAWVFVDRSRNGSRRWCDMAECGNRSKSAAFRARRNRR